MEPPESYSRVWGILVHPSPVQAYLWTSSFIGRISPVYTRGRRDLISCRVVRPKSWRLEGVRIWKLSMTYPGEKPPSLSLLKHRCCLTMHKPIRHLLVMPNILVRIGAPNESGWPYSVPPAQELWNHLWPKIF